MNKRLSPPLVLVVTGLLTGCPDSKSPTSTTGGGPQPISTEVPTMAKTTEPAPDPAKKPSIAGGWSVAVTSEPPGINPDLLETPEQKAKMMFDHFAKAADGKVTVEHKILGKTSEVDADAAADLDAHMHGVDWERVVAETKKDGATEGGTSFAFSITVGQASWEIATTNIERHPDLMKIVDAVKAATGKP